MVKCPIKIFSWFNHSWTFKESKFLVLVYDYDLIIFYLLTSNHPSEFYLEEIQIIKESYPKMRCSYVKILVTFSAAETAWFFTVSVALFTASAPRFDVSAAVSQMFEASWRKHACNNVTYNS